MKDHVGADTADAQRYHEEFHEKPFADAAGRDHQLFRWRL